MANDVRIAISGENLSGAAVSGVNASFAQMQQSAGQTNATLAQTATALAGVEAQGAKLATTLREAGSSQQIIRTLQELAASGNAAAGQVAPLIAQLQRVEGEGSKASLSIRQVDGEIKGLSVSVRQATTATTPWVQAVNQLSSVIPGLSGAIPGLSGALNTYAQSARASAAATTETAAAQGAATTASTGLAAALGPIALGAVAATAAVAGLGAAVKESVSSFGEFQTSMLKVQALTGLSADEAARFADRIRQLAVEGPISAKELGDGLYYISSAGFKGAEAMQVLEATQRMSAAGFGSFTNVADATTSVLKAYHISASDAARVTDILAATVIAGKIETDSFAQSIGLVLPVAAALHVPIDQVGAAIAVMTNNGLSSAEAVTSLKNILGEMLHPTEQGRKALEDMGLTYKQLRDILADPSQGLPAMLALLSARTGENIESMGRIVPDIRGLVGLLALGGENAEEFNRVLGETAGSQGRVAESAKVTATGIEYQTQVMHRSMDEMKLAIGEVAVPPLTELVRHITAGIRNAETLAGSIRGLTSAFGGLGEKLALIPWDKLALLNPFTVGFGTIAAGAGALGAATTPPAPNMGPPARDDWRLGDRTNQAATPPPTPAPAAPPELLSPDQLRATAQVYSQVNSEADKLHQALVDLWKLPDDSNPEVVNKRLGELYKHSEELSQQWLKMFDPANPTQAADRVNHLRTLVDAYTQTVIAGSAAEQQAAQAAIDTYVHDVAAQTQRAADAKKMADYEKQRENEARAAVREAERIAREARQADVGTGLSEAMAKGVSGADLRTDLNPAAAKVMQDFMAALEAQGTQSAAGAGKTLGTAIIGIAEEMRKSGAGDWQETMARMFDVSDAIRRGDPGAVAAFHDLAQHASESIDQAKIAEAWGKQLDAAERQIRQADQRHTNAMTDSANKRADAMADAQRQEGERIADAQARQHVDTEMREEQHGLELQRIRERWAREDVDRAETQARARQDLAERNGRALAEATLRAQESETNAQRQMLRNRQETQIQHQERLAEIQRKGGPGMGQALIDENRSFQDQQTRQQRQDSYATQDRQAQAQQQLAETVRRQAESTADAARKQREAEDDLVKSRARQLADRQQQMDDQDRIATLRKEKEQQYHIDAESKAAQRFATQIDQINRRYEHERQTADRTYAQVGASLVEKLGTAYGELQSRYPWLADMGAGIALPPNLTPQITAPTGFFPLGPLEHHAQGGQFVVSGSPGEGDTKLVQFYATPGEQVGIQPVGNVGGGLNPVAPASNQYFAGTELGATGSFGTAVQSQYPGTDWSTPYASSAPWAQSGLQPSVRYGSPPQGDSGLTVNMDGMFKGATFVGGSPSDAQKLMEVVSQSMIAKVRTILPAGRSPA